MLCGIHCAFFFFFVSTRNAQRLNYRSFALNLRRVDAFGLMTHAFPERNIMPIDVRLSNYLKPLFGLLLPCEPIDTAWTDSRIVIVAIKKTGTALYCPHCGKAGSPRGFANPRLIRHLNFEEIPVWIDVTFPRVYCSEHGHVLAKQSFCGPRCRMSHALEESLLQMICDSDRTESELKRQFRLRGQALSRIVDRARHHFGSRRSSASRPRS